jgi:hypothetical protein
MDQHHQAEQDPDKQPPAVPAENTPETGGDSGYYYDDATGYEVYDPESDDDPDDDSLADHPE